LESKEFRISRMKTEYIECNFSNMVRGNEYILPIDGQEVSEC